MPKRSEIRERTGSMTITMPISAMAAIEQEALLTGRSFSEMMVVLARMGLEQRAAKRSAISAEGRA